MTKKGPEESFFKDQYKIIEDMQLIVGQMVVDDIEENPALAGDFFDCSCCGQNKSLAGSVVYGDYRLCNDCVLLAETSLALKKLEKVSDLIDLMEEKRLEELCEFIKIDEKAQEN